MALSDLKQNVAFFDEVTERISFAGVYAVVLPGETMVFTDITGAARCETERWNSGGNSLSSVRCTHTSASPDQKTLCRA